MQVSLLVIQLGVIVCATCELDLSLTGFGTRSSSGSISACYYYNYYNYVTELWMQTGFTLVQVCAL